MWSNSTGTADLVIFNVLYLTIWRPLNREFTSVLVLSEKVVRTAAHTGHSCTHRALRQTRGTAAHTGHCATNRALRHTWGTAANTGHGGTHGALRHTRGTAANTEHCGTHGSQRHTRGTAANTASHTRHCGTACQSSTKTLMHRIPTSGRRFLFILFQERHQLRHWS